MTDTTAASADTTPSLPTDDELHDQIVNFDVMDFPSPHKFADSNVKMALPTKVQALAPAHREEILAALSNYPVSMREEKEAELVQAKVAELSRAYRIRSGPPEGATPFQRTSWAMTRELADLESKSDAIIAKLAEVSFIDPVTEERTFSVPIGSQQRNGLDAELQRVHHAIGLLHGTEGQARLAQAKAETANQIRARMQDQIDAAEVEKRAAEMAREAKIAQRAAARAKSLSSTHATHAA